MNRSLKKKTVTVMILGGVSIFIQSYANTSPSASPSCMSYREARNKWPTQHLYWATAERCWGLRSTMRQIRVYRPKRHYRDVMTARLQVPTPNQVFDKTPSPEGHQILNLKEINRKLEGCCWPDLERDPNGNIVNAIEADNRRFNDRIKDVPLIWWQQ
jgi:hypothetical protein